MNKGLRTQFIVLSVLASLLCTAAISEESFRLIHVKDVAALYSEHAHFTIYDVNTPDTRQKYGIIPGARLVSSATDYKLTEHLPRAKSSKLIFYCANPMCSASHRAAEIAVRAGFTDVSVMSDGIQGWVKAGQRTAQP